MDDETQIVKMISIDDKTKCPSEKYHVPIRWKPFDENLYALSLADIATLSCFRLLILDLVLWRMKISLKTSTHTGEVL
jgi:hypothetical protein